MRLRFLAFGVFGVGGAEGRVVSSAVGADAGAFVDIGAFGSAVAVEIGAVWVAIGAISRACGCARVLTFRVAVLELRGILTRNFWRG